MTKNIKQTKNNNISQCARWGMGFVEGPGFSSPFFPAIDFSCAQKINYLRRIF